MTPIDRLAIVWFARNGRGSPYAPEAEIVAAAENKPASIDWYARQAEMILQGQSDEGDLSLARSQRWFSRG